MDITLSSTAEKIVRRKIESGSYHSVDEVIGAALELLQEQEQDWGAKIEQGLAEARAGELLDEDEVKPTWPPKRLLGGPPKSANEAIPPHEIGGKGSF